MTLGTFIHFFVQYKYVALFPLAVLEGPLVSVIGGFLISRSVLVFLPTFTVVFLGDVLSDFFFYVIGRSGRKYTRFFRISPERLLRIERQYEQSPWKTMIVAKASYGLGMAFMTASGMAKMSYKKFFYSIAPLNAVRSLILLGIGYYFGKLAINLGQQYLGYYAFLVCIIVPCMYFFFKKKK